MSSSSLLQEVYGVLKDSMSPFSERRCAAERLLSSWIADGGSRAPALLDLAASSSSSFQENNLDGSNENDVAVFVGVRIASAIAIKRWTAKAWREPQQCKSNIKPALPDVRVSLRPAIFEAVARTADEPRVHSQLAEAWRNILHQDFPEQYGGSAAFAAQTASALQAAAAANDVGKVHALLLAARLVVRKYEYKEEGTRISTMAPIVAAVLPAELPMLGSLTQALQHFVANANAAVASNATPPPMNPPNTADMLKLALKTFASTTYLSFPVELAGPLAVNPKPLTQKQMSTIAPNTVPVSQWFELVLQLLATPSPPPVSLVGAHLASDRVAWEGHAFWKVMKRCLLIAYRIFNRYGDVAETNAKATKPEEVLERNLAIFFQMYYYERFQNAVFGILERVPRAAQGGVSRRCINIGVQFVDSAVSMMKHGNKVVAKALQPHIETLIIHIAFPLMEFQQEDEDLWYVCMHNPHLARASREERSGVYGNSLPSAPPFMHSCLAVV